MTPRIKRRHQEHLSPKVAVEVNEEHLLLNKTLGKGSIKDTQVKKKGRNMV